MSLILYSMSKHADLIPPKVPQFLNAMLIQGRLSIPLEFLLPFEEKVGGQIIMADTGNRLRPILDKDDFRSAKMRSKLIFGMIAIFLISKVIVGELLEHKVAKRALFVGVPKSEPAYFSLYSFTFLALLTDCIFEAFAEDIYKDGPDEAEVDLRSKLFMQLMPKDVGLKRGFGYVQVRYDPNDLNRRDEWQKLTDFVKSILMNLQAKVYNFKD